VTFFAQIRFAGKNFPKKLLTFSHNSQNRHPFDTQPAFAAGSGRLTTATDSLMNLLGALASRRRVLVSGFRLAGGTPALPGTVP
jgi:hypothetical protein